jgi:glycosyltransferase involved in cell wall biosynthesis
MKILILMQHPFPGTSPGANHMQRMAMGLRRVGHDAMIVAPRLPGDGLPLKGEDGGVPYVSCAMPAKPKWLPFYPYWAAALRSCMYRTLESLLESTRCDAAIIEGTSWWAFDPLRRLCQSHGVLVAPYGLEWFPPQFRRLFNASWIDQWLQRKLLYPKSDGIIGISRLWREVADEYHLPFVIVPAFNKYPDDDLPPIIESSHQRFRLVFSGKWLGREMPQTIMKGMEIAVKRGIDVELVVLGRVGSRPDERAAMRFLRTCPVRDRINLLGWVEEHVLERELARADALVLLRPDDHEARALFPTRLPEYLATGKPVIVSDAGDLALYLEHRKSAYVLPAGDQPEAMADALLYLATHPQDAKRIGSCGRQALVASFSQDLLGRRIAAFFEMRSATHAHEGEQMPLPENASEQLEQECYAQ